MYTYTYVYVLREYRYIYTDVYILRIYRHIYTRVYGYVVCKCIYISADADCELVGGCVTWEEHVLALALPFGRFGSAKMDILCKHYRWMKHRS